MGRIACSCSDARRNVHSCKVQPLPVEVVFRWCCRDAARTEQTSVGRALLRAGAVLSMCMFAHSSVGWQQFLKRCGRHVTFSFWGATPYSFAGLHGRCLSRRARVAVGVRVSRRCARAHAEACACAPCVPWAWRWRRAARDSPEIRLPSPSRCRCVCAGARRVFSGDYGGIRSRRTLKGTITYTAVES